MKIIEALNVLQSNGVENVSHVTTPNNVWSIDNLKDSINEAIAEDRLDETSDKGEWVVDDEGIVPLGITQLDSDGYRTLNRYVAA